MINKIDNLNIIKEFSEYFVFDDPFLRCYGYYINEKLISFISFSILYDRAELNYIWTNSKYRKNGIATQLIEKMLKECSNVSNVTLEVDINNIEAINLYNKFGFVEVTKRHNYYNNGHDALLMMKEMN